MTQNDISKYLNRIGYSGSTTPNLNTLKAIHWAHMTSVPFENLDIALGKKIVLNSKALSDKIVSRRRGGFCYELNYTFSTLLTALGFNNQLLAARVYGDDKLGPPFDHMLLLVELDQQLWIADVGFGDSFVEPITLDGETYAQMNSQYKLENQDGLYTLMRAKQGQSFQAQYCFDLNTYQLKDYLAACEYQQTSPESSFSHKSVCSIATPQGRKTISNGYFIDSTGEQRTKMAIENYAQYRRILAEHFGMTLAQDAPVSSICAARYDSPS